MASDDGSTAAGCLVWIIIAVAIANYSTEISKVFGTVGSNYQHSVDESALAWNSYARAENCIAPQWFKNELKERPFISFLSITTCSPLVRVSALSLALVLIFFAATTLVNSIEKRSELLNFFGLSIESWPAFFATTFLGLPIAILLMTFLAHFLIWLFVIAFVGEDYYVCYQFTAFIVVSFSMVLLVVTRFEPLLKLLKSKRSILIQLGVLGAVLEFAGVGFTLRDICLTCLGFFR